MGMSLEELKRKNAEEELEDQDKPKPEVEDEIDAVDDKSEDDAEPEGSEEAPKTEEEATEAWMQSDDQTSQDSEVVPLNDLIKMRQKLKGKVSDRNEEIEKLKQEIESLKSSSSKPQAVATSTRPSRDDFLDAEDPDGSYIDALAEWKFSEQQKKIQSDSKQRQQDQFKQDLDKKVEDHYQRAAKLLDENKLNPEVYQAADSGFRRAFEDAFPRQGDAVADSVISQIGDGSEKLVMYVGNNGKRRETLKASLIADPSGMKAMRLIGKWESEMLEPTKRVSQAPSPAKQANGDTTGTPGADRLKKLYEKAHSGKDAQKAFNIKREARAQKIDVSNW